MAPSRAGVYHERGRERPARGTRADRALGSARLPSGEATIREQLEALRIDRSTPTRGGAGRRIFWASIIVLALAAVVAGWLHYRSAEPVAVRTFTVREESAGTAGAATVLNASGYVTARRRATVSAKITGRLSEVTVEEGMPVAEGQVLARLDDSGFRAQFELAGARLAAARTAEQETRVWLDLARLTAERTERLAREGVSNEADRDAARAEVAALLAKLESQAELVRVAEGEVRVAQTELADTVVRAPFDGVVISKDAQPGEMVSPMSAGGGFTRTGICTIVDMDSLEIEVDVNESYISRVRPGQRVEAVLDAYSDWTIPGRVITTVPAADRVRATVLVRIGFDQLDPRILPDMGVKVAFHEEAPGSDDGRAGVPRLLVPSAAVVEQDGQAVVYVVKQSRLERRAVRTGARRGSDVVVEAGLSGGEVIVVDADGALTDGARVRVP